MKTLILHILNSLWNDEAAAKRWIFGLVGFLVTIASMVLVDGVEVAFMWSRRQWAAKIVGAVTALVFSMVNPVGKLPAKAPAPGLQS